MLLGKKSKNVSHFDLWNNLGELQIFEVCTTSYFLMVGQRNCNHLGFPVLEKQKDHFVRAKSDSFSEGMEKVVRLQAEFVSFPNHQAGLEDFIF